ncbi:hypothetical protein BTR23_18000 [Alkalihalophilus pseudofirmus]|nr:hypothetical protein BTR23_18000 [Alkalihalophilus pseudofirmus]
MKYTKILVAYDGSEMSKKAVMKAKEFAETNEQTEINIITVWDLPNAPYEAYDYLNVNMKETFKKQAEENVEEATKLVDGLPNKIVGATLQGYASNTIIKFAEDHNIDLIILGNRGLGGFQRFLLGSVSFHVVQKAQCDILVVK